MNTILYYNTINNDMVFFLNPVNGSWMTAAPPKEVLLLTRTGSVLDWFQLVHLQTGSRWKRTWRLLPVNICVGSSISSAGLVEKTSSAPKRPCDPAEVGAEEDDGYAFILNGGRPVPRGTLWQRWAARPLTGCYIRPSCRCHTLPHRCSLFCFWPVPTKGLTPVHLILCSLSNGNRGLNSSSFQWMTRWSGDVLWSVSFWKGSLCILLFQRKVNGRVGGTFPKRCH